MVNKASANHTEDVLEKVEDGLREIRVDYEPKLSKLVGAHSARDMCEDLETNLARLALTKCLHTRFPSGVAGKYTDEKAATVLKAWFQHLESQGQVSYGFAASCGQGLGNDSADDHVAGEAFLSAIVFPDVP